MLYRGENVTVEMATFGNITPADHFRNTVRLIDFEKVIIYKQLANYWDSAGNFKPPKTPVEGDE
jgi:hypothetical protein